MKEIEVKILEINKQQIEEKLRILGATKIFDGELLTLFFDFQDGRIRKEKNVLRLRKEQGKIELTYKKVQVQKEAKVAEEFSVEVSNIETMTEILRNLGLVVNQKMLKNRTSYKLGEVRFDIDKYKEVYEFIPEFLEIEGSSVDIKKYAAILGFQEKDCLTWSTDELVKYYNKK
jgi:adenylate cyclase, class 2